MSNIIFSLFAICTCIIFWRILSRNICNRPLYRVIFLSAVIPLSNWIQYAICMQTAINNILQNIPQQTLHVTPKTYHFAAISVPCIKCRYHHHHVFNPLNPELNPICYLLPLLAHHFLHFSRIRVKSLTIRLLMSYMYIWSTYSWCF